MKRLTLDITETRHIEVELEASESEYQMIEKACSKHKDITSDNELHSLIEERADNAELTDDSEFRIESVEVQDDDSGEYGDYD